MAWYEKPTVLTKINKEQNYVFIDESGDIKDLSTIIKKIKNNERVEPRDSNFVVTGVYVGFKNLEYIYASMCDFKMKHFGDSKIILHASDIFNKELCIYGTTTPKSLFIEELNDLIDSYRYKVVATAFNKVRYIKKYGLLD